MVEQQIPLICKYDDMPDDYKLAARDYFYKILPLLTKKFNIMPQLGAEGALEAFYELIESGGIKLIPHNGSYLVYLYNLITCQYEEVTELKEELEESDEDIGCQEA